MFSNGPCAGRLLALTNYRWLFGFAALAMFVAGCNREDEQIKVYRVAKAPLDAAASQPGALPANAPTLPSMPGAAPSGPPTAAAPPNWEPQPLAQMRLASFLVHGENGTVADISFVTLGPSAGNTLDNVNRWLSQLAQPPLTAEKLADTVQQLPTARGDVAIVDLTGQPENGDATKDGRIIGAIASDEGQIAFFKMRGNPVLVGAQKENFLKWVSSSRAAKITASAREGTTPPANSETLQIRWEVPPGWSPAAPAPMRYASFAAEKNGEKADISVVTFVGDGGSDVDNVNRWRQQIGLPAVEASALDAMIVSVPGSEINVSTVDMAGATARVVAGWTRHNGRSWFFKLTGPKTVVEQQKPNFVKFLQSVRL